jgi:F-type H+-transporting ATPase subunit delta
MQNPRLANRYAKSLLDLAIESGQLDAVQKDMQLMQALCKHREMANLLKSPVINPDKKQAVLDQVTGGKITELTASFNRLLIRKGRESVLSQIAEAFISQYKDYKKIKVVKLTTAVPVSDAIKKNIVSKVQQNGVGQVELQTEVDPEIIGGFILQIGDKLIDTSVAYDLNNISKQFMNNDFVYKIR